MINAYFNGMRVLGHLYFLFIHYSVEFLNFNQILNKIPVTLLHLIRVSVMFIFVIFFVINGINCGQWITNKIGKNSSNFGLIIKFYINRMAMIFLLTYIYLFSFVIFISFDKERSFLFEMQFKSLLSNLLFIGNLFSLKSNVSFHLYPIINFSYIRRDYKCDSIFITSFLLTNQILKQNIKLKYKKWKGLKLRPIFKVPVLLKIEITK